MKEKLEKDDRSSLEVCHSYKVAAAETKKLSSLLKERVAAFIAPKLGLSLDEVGGKLIGPIDDSRTDGVNKSGLIFRLSSYFSGSRDHNYEKPKDAFFYVEELKKIDGIKHVCQRTNGMGAESLVSTGSYIGILVEFEVDVEKIPTDEAISKETSGTKELISGVV